MDALLIFVYINIMKNMYSFLLNVQYVI